MSRLAENVIVAGRFRLEKKLGQGGMGSVWQAMQLGLDAPCAIKFIEGDFATVPEMQQRFEREAKAAASLRSPHVVQIIDHALWDGIPFIAMELLVGEDLGKRIEKVGALGVEQTLEILAQVCRALHKAHSMGIVHRDLKPDNIFLVKDDEREIAKVLDFGIAKSTKANETGSNTRTGAMLGTPYYMSPEQAQGIKAVDFRSDLWSMAVIAFQCLTGRLPFESEALGDLLIKIMVSPLPRPSEVANVPPGFDAWFAKAASREPTQRFGSAKEFIESLSTAVLPDKTQVRATPGVAEHGGTLALANANVPRPLQSTPNPIQPRTIGMGTPIPTATPSPVRGIAPGTPIPIGTPSPMSQTTTGVTKSGKSPATVIAVVTVAVMAAVIGTLIALRLASSRTKSVESASSAASASAPPHETLAIASGTPSAIASVGATAGTASAKPSDSSNIPPVDLTNVANMENTGIHPTPSVGTSAATSTAATAGTHAHATAIAATHATAPVTTGAATTTSVATAKPTAATAPTAAPTKRDLGF